MKKVVLTVVTVMTFAMGFAETTPSHRMMFDRQPVSYDMSFDMHRLAVKLGLTFEQMETVEVIQNCFNNEVQEAATSRGLQRRHLIHQAVRKDAQQMRRVLNDEQFNTYMTLLGTTLRNKGL
jgi:hypothetical protein